MLPTGRQSLRGSGNYFRQRKKGGVIRVIFFDYQTGKQIDRTTGTNDEKKAYEIAQSWLADGLPGKLQKNHLAGKHLQFPIDKNNAK